MLKVITEKGELVNLRANEKGELYVVANVSGQEGGNENVTVNNKDDNPVSVKTVNPVTIPDNFKVNNTTANPIPVEVTNQITEETTLNASIQTVGSSTTTIAINKKVTSIDIANYSETANLTIVAAGITSVIGPNIATTLKLNKQVDNITLSATEENIKVQLIVSGEE